MNQVKNFKNKAVKDLVWLITSPPLISAKDELKYYLPINYYQKLWQKNKNWIKVLDKNPQPLLDFIAGKPTYQLGRYCEILLNFFFTHSPNYELLENNLQLKKNNITIGEVDFIVKEIDSKEIIHIELAVKFFIGKNAEPNMYEFIGANGNDRLDLKIKKINQQIKISENYPELFLKFTQQRIMKKKVFFKGVIFYDENLPISSKILNSDHLRGRKIIFDEKFHISENSTFYFPNRLEWLTAPSDANFIDSSGALIKIKAILKNKYATLIYEKNKRSIQRIFIVHPNWPTT